MIHLLTLLVCISSVEIFMRSNFLQISNLLLKVMGKVIHIIRRNNISDHWKEKCLPRYALIMMRYSFQTLIILLSIASLFFTINHFFGGFLDFSTSLVGLLEAIFFASIYLWVRKFLVR